MKDFHTHPQIIRGIDRFDAFAQTAIQNGIDQICITDHMPLSCSTASDRIPQGKISEYCAKAREIAERYKDILTVKCGIEMDYHPSLCKEIEDVLKEGDFDFVLGSSHLHVIPGMLVNAETRNGYAQAMLENTLSAVKSGYFNAIAHMDMYRWVFSCPQRFPLADDQFSEEKHQALIETVLDAIQENDLFLEINPHFAHAAGSLESAYPSPSITELAFAKGIRFSYGSDAHVPEDVGVLLDDLKNHAIYGPALQGWEQSKNFTHFANGGECK